MNTIKLTGYTLAVAASLLLVACGGGGGGGVSAPPAPELSLGYGQVKQLQFSWSDVAGETEYRLLENRDGVSGYSQVTTITADSSGYDHTVFLPARLNARYMLQACNSAGCADSVEVTVDVPAMSAAIGYFKASNTEASDFFGYAVSLSADGNTLAVGAHFEDSMATDVNNPASDDNSKNQSGAVYVFVHDAVGLWTQQAYIKASNTDTDDRFGHAISLSADGNTLAVGAFGEASNATGIGGDQNDNSANNSGAVYVFTRAGSTWSQQAYVKASNTEADDLFGLAVSLSADGNTLAAGANGEDSDAIGIDGENNNNALWSGAAYVFTRTGDDWTQQAYIKASNTDGGDEFGYAVSLSADGNSLTVGAPGEASNATGIGGDESDDSANNSGAVYVFTRAGSTWSQQAYVKASNTDGGDNFGLAVSLSADGNTLAVGAWNEDSATTGIGGNDEDDLADSSGAVYVFVRIVGLWSQQAYVKASNTDGGDNFGRAASLSADGNTLVVGAWAEDSATTGIGGVASDNSAIDSGAVYVFTRAGSTWSQQAYVKASNTGAVDRFGQFVSLSADGSTLAVGAYLEGSAATGIDGDQTDNSAGGSGAVYLY